MHKPKGTQELQFDECSHLYHMYTKEVGYVYCAPKYVLMKFLSRAYAHFLNLFHSLPNECNYS